jgi:hypothetical protein
VACNRQSKSTQKKGISGRGQKGKVLVDSIDATEVMARNRKEKSQFKFNAENDIEDHLRGKYNMKVHILKKDKNKNLAKDEKERERERDTERYAKEPNRKRIETDKKRRVRKRKKREREGEKGEREVV